MMFKDIIQERLTILIICYNKCAKNTKIELGLIKLSQK